MSIFPIVFVQWDDSYSTDEWLYFEEDNWPDHFTCFTSGFLIKESDQALTLALTVSDDLVGQTITIPKFAIKEQKVIRFGK